MYPIYINDNKSVLPSDDNFYILGKDGIYLKQNLYLSESIIKIKEIPTLNKVNEFVKLKITKIKFSDFSNIVNFFKRVINEYSSEAIVLLYYDYSNKKFIIYCPKQLVSGGSVNYSDIPSAYTFGKSFTLLGSIHSHPGSAFHSHGDSNDEKNWDGLHLTIGNLKGENIEISCSIMFEGKRYMVDPENHIIGLKKIEDVNNKKKSYYYEMPEKHSAKLVDRWFNQVEHEDLSKKFKEIVENLRNNNNFFNTNDMRNGFYKDEYFNFFDVEYNSFQDFYLKNIEVANNKINVDPCKNCIHNKNRTELKILP